MVIFISENKSLYNVFANRDTDNNYRINILSDAKKFEA
jgi:hypothetical protein